jgi:hypothetical protein
MPEPRVKGKKDVFHAGGSRFGHYSQCKRWATTADGFCAIHSLEGVAARKQKSADHWQSRYAQRMAPFAQIGQLEAENKALRAVCNNLACALELNNLDGKKALASQLSAHGLTEN